MFKFKVGVYGRKFGNLEWRGMGYIPQGMAYITFPKHKEWHKPKCGMKGQHKDGTEGKCGDGVEWHGVYYLQGGHP
jgi:hypothetical protein